MKGKGITAKKNDQRLYQFRIKLNGVNPPMWRRLQVEDCDLQKLHLYFQAAMGWHDSQLYRIRVGTKRFTFPGTLDEDQYDIDSTAILISEVLPKDGSRFRFVYEYDLADGWLHGVLFEGFPKVEQGQDYPLCVEGEGACPPEDIGGVWGYSKLLEAIARPRRKSSKVLVALFGPFDPNKFDATEATKRMQEII